MSPQSPNHFGLSVGARIRAVRQARRLTQGQLAGRDFSVSYISAIERGQIQPSIRALEILAARLQVSTRSLLPETEAEAALPPPVAAGGSGFGAQALRQLQDELLLRMLEAEVWIHEGKLAQAVEQLRNMASGLLPRHEQARVYYLLALAAFSGGHLPEAEKQLAQSLQLLQESGASALKVRILFLYGLMHVSMQNYYQAEFFYERCTEMLERLSPQDYFLSLRVYLSLGQYYLAQRRPEQAVAPLQRAIALSKAEAAAPGGAMAQRLVQAYHRLSEEYADCGEYFLARLYTYKAIYTSLERMLERFKGELIHACYETLLHLDDEASRHQLLARLQELSGSGEPLPAASACVHLADWSFAQADLNEARHFAEQALTLAGPFGDSLIQAEALLLLGRLAYAERRYEQGDRLFQEALKMLERLNTERARLAEHYSLYARLLEERGEVRQAFLYFRRAYEAGQGRLPRS
jgi:tetratricopeptide (TPR) repeat protein